MKKDDLLRIWVMATVAQLLLMPVAAIGQGAAPESILDALDSSERILFVGAHQDDENSSTGFLARSVGAGKATSLICFTRGENEPMDVGVKKGKAMGDARVKWLQDSAYVLGIDTLVQLPYTNGPSTVAELENGAIRFWPRDTKYEEVVTHWRSIGSDPYEDMVRYIRKLRPDLIVTWEKSKGWTGNSEHRTVGWLAERAFIAAGDPTVFPNQISDEGLQPWNPRFLYWALSGKSDKVGEHPVNVVPCNVPGSHNMTACETKLRVGLTYARNWGREISEEQEVMMLDEYRKKVEYFQLGLYQ